MGQRTRYVCKCQCGGNVRGVRDFGRLWTWCTKCTPVVKVNLGRLKPKPIPPVQKGTA